MLYFIGFLYDDEVMRQSFSSSINSNTIVEILDTDDMHIERISVSEIYIAYMRGLRFGNISLDTETNQLSFKYIQKDIFPDNIDTKELLVTTIYQFSKYIKALYIWYNGYGYSIRLDSSDNINVCEQYFCELPPSAVVEVRSLGVNTDGILELELCGIVAIQCLETFKFTFNKGVVTVDDTGVWRGRIGKPIPKNKFKRMVLQTVMRR